LISATSVRLSAPNDLGLELALVGQANQNLVGRIDHVGIGQDVAVGADDEAGTQRTALELARRIPGIPGIPGWRGMKRRKNSYIGSSSSNGKGCAPAHCCARLGGADVDHRRPLLLHQFGEVRQAATLRLRRAAKKPSKGKLQAIVSWQQNLLSVTTEWRKNASNLGTGRKVKTPIDGCNADRRMRAAAHAANPASRPADRRWRRR
jgi:hypothetical protein